MNEKKPSKSNLNLIKNNVLETTLKINPNIEFSDWYSDEEHELEISLESNFALNSEDSSAARLTMCVYLFDEDFEENSLPFFCMVKMAFIFADSEGDYTKEDNVITRYGLNMISIAYPYVRSFVSVLTSTSGIEQVHIPTINVFNTFRKKV